MTIVKDTLIKARALIADPKHWTKRANARDAEGAKVSAKDSRAVCWCSLGAVAHSTLRSGSDGYDGYDWETVDKALEELSVAAGVKDKDYIITVNDSKGVSHPMILAIFDKAIERLQSEHS